MGSSFHRCTTGSAQCSRGIEQTESITVWSAPSSAMLRRATFRFVDSDVELGDYQDYH